MNIKYLIECNDQDSTLYKMLKLIQEKGNTGATFAIHVDTEDEDAKRFIWDGDGADRIYSISK